MSDEDAASRREAEAFERQGDQLVKADDREQANAFYRQAQKILMPVAKMWSDAVEYDLRMAAFQRIQEKLWALAAGGPVRPGLGAPAATDKIPAAPPVLPKPPPQFGPSAAARTFEDSMAIGYEQWHDGIGYDLEALARMSEPERQAVATMLASRVRTGRGGWRDIEALAALKTNDAKETLIQALKTSDPQARLHVARELEGMGVAVEIDKIIGEILRRGGFGEGVSLALTLAPQYDTPHLRKVLLDCTRVGDRTVRVHAAALCLYLAGKAKSPFDWAQRPFFLEFAEEDIATRKRAYAELRRRLADTTETAPET